MRENLKEVFENMEKEKKLLEAQEVMLKESDEKVKQAANTLSEKIDSLKGQLHLKQLNLVSAIDEKEKQISKLVADSLLDQNPSEELRNLAIEMDILKRQEAALEDGLRKTIIAACDKELADLKQAHKEAYTQHFVIHELYISYLKSINLAIKALNQELNDKRSASSIIENNLAHVYIDTIKPFAEYMFNQETKSPEDSEKDLPTQYELVTKYIIHKTFGESKAAANEILAQLK